jgi:hypothetical protein
MLIHLGKVYLGQTDRLDATNQGARTVVYIERASNPRDAELNGIGGADTLFHIPDNGRDTVIMLPAKDAEIGNPESGVVGGEIATT